MITALKRVFASSAGEAAGRAVNVALPLAVLYLHGAGLAADGFFLALAFAFFVQGTAANALAAALVPVLARGRECFDLRFYVGHASGCAALVALPAVWFSGDYFDASDGILVFLGVWLSGAAGLIAAPAVAALGVEHRYSPAGLSWALRVFPLGAYLLWAPPAAQLSLLLFGVALADALRCVLLCYMARASLALSSGVRLPFPVESTYLLASSLVVGLVPLTVRWLASLGATGSVSIFEMADRVFAAVASLATLGIGNVALVYLAHAQSSAERRGLSLRMLRAGLGWSLVWAGGIIAVAFSLPWLAGWTGALGGTDLDRVAQVLWVLAAGLPAFVLHMLMSRAIIAAGLARVLPGMALAGLIATLVVSAMLQGGYGPAGLAAGVVAGQYLVLALMFRVFFGRRCGEDIGAR